MRKIPRSVLAVSLAAGLVAGSAVAAPSAYAKDITDRLKAIPGMKLIWEKPSGDPAYRFFMLSYKQPADHRNPAKGTFEQRFTLLHKNESRPMVLATSGYNVRETPRRSEPSRLVDGNEISTEQRYFAPSRPDPADWKSQLNIWQAATDHHRLSAALKVIYQKKWISTGVSKGGMTSTYHRRFYPKDVDGIVAYVAPNDVRNDSDRAYDRFFDRVGNDPKCRTALRKVQAEALKRRKEFVPRMEQYAADNKLTFKVFGSAERAYEGTVLDLEWGFWQYMLQKDCATIPDARKATTDELWTYIDKVGGFSAYSDQSGAPYVPYYYQAANQLGWYKLKYRYIRHLAKYPEVTQAPQGVPHELRPVKFQQTAMRDIDRWVQRDGSQLMFIYAGNDPWGAEPFRLGRGTKDSFWYEVAGQNHNGSLISFMPEAEKQKATAAITRWAAAGTAPQVRTYQSPLDKDDLLERRPPL